MGVKGKMEVEIDIKSHGDLFHELFGKKPHHIPNVIPHLIHSCQVHEGEFGKPGSVIYWEYTHDGEKCYAKNIVEAIDEENKSVRFKVVEGNILSGFKDKTISVHVIPKGEITTVIWSVEFEKLTDDGPYPTKFMDYSIQVTREIESQHLKT